MIKIGIFALTSCMFSSISGPLDFFSIASSEWAKDNNDSNSPLFDVKIISLEKKKIICFNGIEIRPDMAINECDIFDIIIIPVIVGDLKPILSDKKLIKWLIEQSKAGSCLCSVCAGSFVIAQTGLLSGKHATTHWKLADEFKLNFPEVILKKEKMLVDEGNFITAGGVTAYMDLSIYIVKMFASRELATSISKILLIDSARSLQSPYQTYNNYKAHSDHEILKVQEWIGKNYEKQISISKLSNIAGLGERTLARRFKKAIGESPIEYIQQIRIEVARDLLEISNDTVESIVFKIGYEDISSFRRLFKKYTGLSPIAYRKRFSIN